MHPQALIFAFTSLILFHLVRAIPHDLDQRSVAGAADLFSSLEELARIVSISYCVGDYKNISLPFTCDGRCDEFPNIKLVDIWNTPDSQKDSCGYIAIEHGHTSQGQGNGTGRIIVAFRGSISGANWLADLSIIPQAYAPYPTDPQANPPPVGDSSDSVEEKKPKDENTSTFRKVVGWTVEHVSVFFKSIANIFYKDPKIAEGNANSADSAIGENGKCISCTVHTGFYESYRAARPIVIDTIKDLKKKYPDYELHLVGHSLGGAVAPFMGLECVDRGWDPIVTTFGAPRIGNLAFTNYLERKFKINKNSTTDLSSKFRRVTHKDDLVPLLPLKHWGYQSNAGEIFISKHDLPATQWDLKMCQGREDTACIRGEDTAQEIILESILGGSTAWLGQLFSRVDDNDMNTEANLERRFDLEPFDFVTAHRQYFLIVGGCTKRDPST